MKTPDLYKRAVQIQTERRQVAVDGKLSGKQKETRGKELAAELQRIHKSLQAAIYDDMRQLASVEKVLTSTMERARATYQPDFAKLAYYADKVRSIVKGGKIAEIEQAYSSAQTRKDLDELQAWQDVAPGLLLENKYYQQDQLKALDLRNTIKAWEPVDMSEFRGVTDDVIRAALEVQGIARDAGSLFFNDPAYRTPAGTFEGYFNECAQVGRGDNSVSLQFSESIPVAQSEG